MEEANIVVIGGGVIGLSVAAQLSKTNEGVYVLEKNRRIAQESSSHNSGVIHSGIHYPHGTLKAELCTRGNTELYRLCRDQNIPCKRLGKLTVAVSEEEIPDLDRLVKNGEENGVKGMSIIDKQGIKKMEPNIVGEMAIYTESTGIVEPDELSNYFMSVLKNNNGTVVTDTEVTGIEDRGNIYLLRGSSAGKKFNFYSRTVVNSGGLNSDQIASFVGLDVDRLGYRLTYKKGDYYRIKGDPPVKMLVYPVPQGNWLGIHMTPDMAGSVKLGPNSYYVDEIDYSVESNSDQFMEEVRRLMPAVAGIEIQPDSAGIRPALAAHGSSFPDFIIKHEREHGHYGFINLIGMDSPGLTASPAIGEYVAQIYENEIDE